MSDGWRQSMRHRSRSSTPARRSATSPSRSAGLAADTSRFAATARSGSGTSSTSATRDAWSRTASSRYAPRPAHAPPVARLLQKTPIGDLPAVRNVEFVGEYPVAELRFSDPALPVKISLRAFSPLYPDERERLGHTGGNVRVHASEPQPGGCRGIASLDPAERRGI